MKLLWLQLIMISFWLTFFCDPKCLVDCCLTHKWSLAFYFVAFSCKLCYYYSLISHNFWWPAVTDQINGLRTGFVYLYIKSFRCGCVTSLTCANHLVQHMKYTNLVFQALLLMGNSCLAADISARQVKKWWDSHITWAGNLELAVWSFARVTVGLKTLEILSFLVLFITRQLIGFWMEAISLFCFSEHSADFVASVYYLLTCHYESRTFFERGSNFNNIYKFMWWYKN